MKKHIQKFYTANLKPLISRFVSMYKTVIYMLRKNRRIHTILKVLTLAEKQGERETKHGSSVEELGRSRSNLELHLDTNIRIDTINDLCFKLVNMGYLKANGVKEDNKINRFNITPAGRIAIIDNIFLNKVWWRNWEIWKWLLPTLIGLSTGVIAILAYLK